MKRSVAIAAIQEEMVDILKTSVRNIFGSIGTESTGKQAEQLDTGFERVKAFELLAIDRATKIFLE